MNGSARRRHWTFGNTVIAASLSAVLMLTGCNRTDPVTAPTSTLPAPGTVAETPTAPAYETELGLTPEEKVEVEAALVALDGFVEFTNQLYLSGGKQIDGAELVAAADSLSELEDASAEMIKNNTVMIGEVEIHNRIVTSLSSDGPGRKASIEACSPAASYNIVKQGSTETPKPDDENPVFEFSLEQVKSEWKVSKQTWIKDKCES